MVVVTGYRWLVLEVARGCTGMVGCALDSRWERWQVGEIDRPRARWGDSKGAREELRG